MSHAPPPLSAEAIAHVNAGARRVVEAARALAISAGTLSGSLRALGERQYVAGEQAYRERFGALPGSDRTARLRKKRRDAVLRWIAAEEKP